MGRLVAKHECANCERNDQERRNRQGRVKRQRRTQLRHVVPCPFLIGQPGKLPRLFRVEMKHWRTLSDNSMPIAAPALRIANPIPAERKKSGQKEEPANKLL